MGTLSGENVLVIGGSSGIRYATADGAQGEDCADQILLMLRNTFMTGSVVYIDGGGLLI